MKLDDRIIDRKYIFDCFSSDKAKDYIGKQCYMTDDFDKFSNLDDVGFGTLYEIDDYFKSSPDDWFTFCLPVKFVVPKEKKFKPYNIEEFCNEGFEIVVFRSKEHHDYEYHVRYNGYMRCDAVYKVILGNINYTLDDLFEEYEYLDNDGNWNTFGVEE